MSVALAFIACLASVFYRPLVMVDGWQWFIVPLGVKPLGYWQAWGVLAVVLFATQTGSGRPRPSGGAEPTKSEWAQHLWVTALVPAFSHAFMWCIR